MDIEAQLASVTLFHGLNEQALATIAGLGKPRILVAGEILVEEGQRNDTLHVVLAGKLDISLPKSAERLRTIHLRTCHAGEVVGEYSAFDQDLVSAQVQAITACEVLQIDAKLLNAMMRKNAPVASRVYRNVIRTLIRRLRDKDAELDILVPF
jgi:CRP/FNR family cyclic AMP-dependent transcriptional regulator